ncbi:zf-HC2 domain-containing protein [Catenulispora rubra]|uniref:zf-HC2 domain-containing protein n=1 Tax=Catenulispora rubra TaxID=280293 RepID=UPI0018920270|nr:zf-HC2 domain-containing protein [Catenulispora rubra]
MTQGSEAVVDPGEWHVAEEELRHYAAGECTPPSLWSTEAHLTACQTCRLKLAELADPAQLAAGWSRLDAAMDAPVPGRLERLLVRVGVPEATARLLAVTPVLRLSWFASIVVVLLVSTASAHLANAVSTPIVFLALAPLLPLAGVAVSFGPRVDPSYELALVAPLQTFRLLLLRCAVVLATTSLLSFAAALALPEYGLVALGWVLPSLTLTLLSLALTPRLGPLTAVAVVTAGWIALLAVTVHPHTGRSVVFALGGQLAMAAVGVSAAVVLPRLRSRFESDRHPDLVARRVTRRTP